MAFRSNRIGVNKDPHTGQFYLDVSGGINIDGSIFQYGVEFVGGGGGESFWTQSGSDIYYTDGNVGIGTASPRTRLEIQNTKNTPTLIIYAPSIAGDSAFSGYSSIAFTGTNSGVTTNSEIRSYSNLNFQHGSRLTFLTSNNAGGGVIERMRIDEGGNVGMGTVSPAFALDIQRAGTTASIKLVKTDSPTATWHLHSGRLNTGEFSIADGTSYRLTVAAGGNVGIGTTTPGAKLEVKAGVESQSSPVEAIRIWGPNVPNNSNGAQDLKWAFSGAGSSGIRSYRMASWGTEMQFLTNLNAGSSDSPQIRMHISNAGDIGIGKTAVNHKLDVAGKTNSDSGFQTGNYEMVHNTGTDSLDFNYIG
jgi:hypothetical protein